MRGLTGAAARPSASACTAAMRRRPALLQRRRNAVGDNPSSAATETEISGDGAAYNSCRVGGLLLAVRDAEAMGRLAHVADTVARLPEPPPRPIRPIRHPAHRARLRRGRDHPGPACVHNLAVVHRTGQAALKTAGAATLHL